MKKKILVIMTTAILALGAITVVYAKGDNNVNNFKFGRGMMYQSNSNISGFSRGMMKKNNINNNDSYNKMIGLMKENGFQEGAKAMENGDYSAMSNFMNNITDEEYNQMINIMKNNGYDGMSKMMGALSRQEMINRHNTMMGR